VSDFSASVLTASVLIPSSGRPGVLEATLEALCHQDIPRDEFEVIVVDDGARPPLAARVDPYRERLAVRTVRREPGRQPGGPAAARNAAAALARSPLLIFLDDDCAPDPGWLRAYRDAFEQAPDCALAGPIVNGLPDDRYAEACHVVFGYLYSRHVEGRGTTTGAPFVISANFGVPAALFASVGGFDERFSLASEDRMFSAEWLRAGRKFRAVPGAVVRHYRPLTLRSFLAQQYRYGRGGMIFRKEIRACGPALPAAEGISFYFRLLMTPLRRPTRGRRVSLFLLVALSQAATAAGYAREWGRPPLLPRGDRVAL
jgi:GT2 family glycosyltransferase